MARIFLEGVDVYSFHGHSKEERKIGGKYRVDLFFDVGTSGAESSDELKDTVNYEKVHKIIQLQMAEPSKLLEHLARKILNGIAAEFPQMLYINVRISKMHPPIPGIMQSVAVELEHKS